MSSVFLQNVDDYLAGGTSQACVNPLFAAPASGGDASGGSRNKTSRVSLLQQGDDEIDPTTTSLPAATPTNVRPRRRRRRVMVAESDSTTRDNQTATSSTKITSPSKGTPAAEKATLRLSDCLACSGCITTTEAMLVEQQSLSHFRSQFPRTERGVMSVSLASWTDWIRHLYSDGTEARLQEAVRRLAAFLAEEFHLSRIVDAGGEPLRTSLEASAEEFVVRFRRHLERKQLVESDKKTTASTTISRGGLLSWDTPSVALSPTETRFLISDANGTMTPQIVTQVANGRDERLVQALTGSPSSLESPPPLLPLLTSSCPGFVCFVEKTTPSLIPLLCSVQSPMMLSSSSPAKESWQVAVMPCHDKKLEAGRPTFDSRVDFVLTTRDVVQALEEAVLRDRLPSDDVSKDVLVTPCEIRQYLQQRFDPQEIFCCLHTEKEIEEEDKEKLHQCATNPFRPVLITSCQADAILSPAPNKQDESTQTNPQLFLSSGGYAEFIFRHACRVLFDYDAPSVLPWRPARRAGGSGMVRRSKKAAAAAASRGDFWQVTLYRHVKQGSYSLKRNDDSTDEAVLHFAIAYGFPSIQSLMQMLKEDALPFHFVEVMACPSGCLNGNGQIPRANETPTESRNRIQEAQLVLSDFWTLPPTRRAFGGGRNDIFTQFHVVPPMELSTGLAAGVAVKDTQW